MWSRYSVIYTGRTSVDKGFCRQELSFRPENSKEMVLSDDKFVSTSVLAYNDDGDEETAEATTRTSVDGDDGDWEDGANAADGADGGIDADK